MKFGKHLCLQAFMNPARSIDEIGASIYRHVQKIQLVQVSFVSTAKILTSTTAKKVKRTFT